MRNKQKLLSAQAQGKEEFQDPLRQRGLVLHQQVTPEVHPHLLPMPIESILPTELPPPLLHAQQTREAHIET